MTTRAALVPVADLAPAAANVIHPAPFACALTVGPGDVSASVPHVSNTVSLEWFVQAAQLHCDAFGRTVDALMASDRMWFVARHEIDYHTEASPNDELMIYTWIRRMKGVKACREYRLWRPADERLICSGLTIWVYVTLSTRRPARIEPMWFDAFTPLETPASAPGPTRCPSGGT